MSRPDNNLPNGLIKRAFDHRLDSRLRRRYYERIASWLRYFEHGLAVLTVFSSASSIAALVKANPYWTGALVIAAAISSVLSTILGLSARRKTFMDLHDEALEQERQWEKYWQRSITINGTLDVDAVENGFDALIKRDNEIKSKVSDHRQVRYLKRKIQDQIENAMRSDEFWPARLPDNLPTESTHA